VGFGIDHHALLWCEQLITGVATAFATMLQSCYTAPPQLPQRPGAAAKGDAAAAPLGDSGGDRAVGVGEGAWQPLLPDPYVSSAGGGGGSNVAAPSLLRNSRCDATSRLHLFRAVFMHRHFQVQVLQAHTARHPRRPLSPLHGFSANVAAAAASGFASGTAWSETGPGSHLQQQQQPDVVLQAANKKGGGGVAGGVRKLTPAAGSVAVDAAAVSQSLGQRLHALLLEPSLTQLILRHYDTGFGALVWGLHLLLGLHPQHALEGLATSPAGYAASCLVRYSPVVMSWAAVVVCLAIAGLLMDRAAAELAAPPTAPFALAPGSAQAVSTTARWLSCSAHSGFSGAGGAAIGRAAGGCAVHAHRSFLA
jgi:hypothetical protein